MAGNLQEAADHVAHGRFIVQHQDVAAGHAFGFYDLRLEVELIVGRGRLLQPGQINAHRGSASGL